MLVKFGIHASARRDSELEGELSTQPLANKDESLRNIHTCFGPLFAAERRQDKQCL
jgi:hypothetical protein